MGGSGMRALAGVLAARGWEVYGSDSSPEVCTSLAAAGWPAAVGHHAKHIDPSARLVVHSAAIDPRNPELYGARLLNIPVVSYAEMLGRLMTGRHRLAVAGTHGKSTITAMAGQILAVAGLDPTVICGATARDNSLGGGRHGVSQCNSDLVLVEACEYRGSFLKLRPNRAVISGIEGDHFDCYPTRESLVGAFAQFVDLLPGDGLLLVPAADVAAQRMALAGPCRRETFGLTLGCDWQAMELASQAGRFAFTIRYDGKLLGRVKLRVAGRHNVVNALAAAALATSAGATPNDVTAGLSHFRGLKRRLEYIGRFGGVQLWDDYAHHPTAVAAVHSALREIYPHARLCAVFEPHQVSRTAALLDEFAAALAQFDIVAVTDVFQARETPQAGDVTAHDLAERIRSRGATVLPTHRSDEICAQLPAACRPTDVCVTMGAGAIGKLCHALRDRL
jgi:UDP-N-acetylmuramate--alanine ligase